MLGHFTPEGKKKGNFILVHTIREKQSSIPKPIVHRKYLNNNKNRASSHSIPVVIINCLSFPKFPDSVLQSLTVRMAFVAVPISPDCASPCTAAGTNRVLHSPPMTSPAYIRRLTSCSHSVCRRVRMSYAAKRSATFASSTNAMWTNAESRLHYYQRHRRRRIGRPTFGRHDDCAPMDSALPDFDDPMTIERRRRYSDPACCCVVDVGRAN